MDKLQTNHRGVFVLKDNNFKWLSRFGGADDDASKAAAQRLLNFPSGMLRGALANLGICASVSADFTQLPACAFNIRVRNQP